MPIQKLPVTSLDDINHRRRARETLNQVLDHSFDDSRRQTDAEKLADLTPYNPAYEPGDSRRWVPPGSGPTEARMALQRCIDSSLDIRIAEAYEIDAELTLLSDRTLTFSDGGSITLAAGVTNQYIFNGNAVDNVKFINAQIYGNGLSGQSAFFLQTCTDIEFDRCTIMYAGGMALLLRGCTRVLVDSCELSQNYYYAVEDKNGTRNRYTNNRCFSNGDTGTASNTGGRGIVLWMCTDCTVDNNSFVDNTEYGFRIYSQTGAPADTFSSQGNHVTNNFFQDNDSADIVLYDEGLAGTLVIRNVIADNIIIRSTNPGLGVSFLCSGGDNDIHDNHIFKEGAFGNFVGFNLYYGIRNKIHHCSVSNTADVLGFSSAVDCDVDAVHGYTVATVAGSAGTYLSSGCSIRNGYYKHGGGGVSDVGIVNYNSSGLNTISGNTLDGFNVGIYIQAEAVRIVNNKTLNSGVYGFRKDNDGQAGQELIGNVWGVTNPAMNLYLERKAAGAATLVSSAAPTTRTWAVGDRCWNSAPSVGNPKSWVCTAAGTPGTWTSEGNL